MPAPAQAQTEPPSDEQLAPEPESEEAPDESDSSGDEAAPSSADPSGIETETNPLNPAGDSLDRLIEMQINEDTWKAMMGELPCLDATEACVRQLQEKAIENSPALSAIDQRVELVNEKIDQARTNNQRTVSLGLFEPAIQYLLQTSTTAAVPEVRNAQGQVTIAAQPAQSRGIVDTLLGFITGTGTLSTVNSLLSLIGIPLFRSATGGDAASQTREIAIADLQIKIAEIENQRGKLANDLREQVTLQVLDFDTIRREFQISQETARRSTLRLQILDLNYRFAVGGLDTPQYLAEVNALDQQRAQTFRAWARLRTQLTRIKLLVLSEGLES